MGLYTIIGPYWSPLISDDVMHDCSTYWLRNFMNQTIVGLHLPAIKIHHGSVRGRASTCPGVQPDSCFPGSELLARASVAAQRV